MAEKRESLRGFSVVAALAFLFLPHDAFAYVTGRGSASLEPLCAELCGLCGVLYLAWGLFLAFKQKKAAPEKPAQIPHALIYIVCGGLLVLYPTLFFMSRPEFDEAQWAYVGGYPAIYEAARVYGLALPAAIVFPLVAQLFRKK